MMGGWHFSGIYGMMRKEVTGLKRLTKDFFERDTVEVAKELIGCTLIRRCGETEAAAIITETEAYKGFEDAASHAFRGMTPRNKVMFGEPGRLYVYFTYGMHHCMNIVTEKEGVAGAVLLRAAVPLQGEEWFAGNRPKAAPRQWMNGPGKLTQAFAIDLSLNGLDLADSRQDGLTVLEGQPLPFLSTPRIGISKATELPWRFVAAAPPAKRQ